ncbi:S8 family serine peptidase [Actinotignum sp. GS-2025c]|uniref:S8 family serine peptidase n=1 Tax=Actinotignum sp. GS-2025c TaxID=3427276 RepID=UPI003F4886E9
MAEQPRWRRFGVTCACAALVGGALAPATAAATESDGHEPLDIRATVAAAESDPNFTGKWFIELKSEPLIRGGSSARIAGEQREFTQTVENDGGEVDTSYQHVWNGVTVEADSVELARYVNDANVIGVYPVLTVERPAEVESAAEMNRPGETPDMYSARDMTGASVANEEFGFTGKGVRVGIIDSGVAIDHPAFGGNGVKGERAFPNDKIVTGYDFVGDSFNTDRSDPNFQPVPHPDALPDDCGAGGGHGSHVAGIAAGNDPESTFKGVAPDAVIGAYRVFGCTGSTSSEVILSALERAQRDKMDVVNMSIGAAFATWPNYPTAVASENLVASGVVVTASQGNSGAKGIFSGSAPAVGPSVIAVGSVDNTHVLRPVVMFNGGPEGFETVTESPAVPTAGRVDVVAYPEGQKTGAVDLPGTPFTGKAVLVSRGTSTFYQKARAAQDDGAAAVIIYNNQPGTINATIAGNPPVTIPVIAVTQEQGERFEEAAAAGNASLEWTDAKRVATSPTGGKISDFSSWGLAADLQLKPDVVAPGGNIYSAWPVDDAVTPSWKTISGTSMAAPHVAGSAALLLQANPNLTPAQVRTALQNTADPVTVDGSADAPKLATHRQGAGLVNLPAALAAVTEPGTNGGGAPTAITPAKISLGDSDVQETTTLTVHNASAAPVTYTFTADTHVRATSGPHDRFTTYNGTDAQVAISPAQVTVQPGADAQVQVSVTDPTNVPEGAIYGGYVVAHGDDNSTYQVPFAGLKGDYENALQFLHTTWKVKDIRPDIAQKRPDLANLLAYDPPSLTKLIACPNPATIYKGECLDKGAQYSNAPNSELFAYAMDYANGAVPVVEYHIDSPVQKLEIRVFHANEDGSKGAPVSENNVVHSEDGVGRTDLGRFAWDGTYLKSASATTRTAAAPGRYVFELRVVKGTGGGTTEPSGETLPGFTRSSSEETFVTAPFCVKECTTPQPTPTPEPTPSEKPEPSAPAPSPSVEPTTPAPAPTPSVEPTVDPTTPVPVPTPSVEPTEPAPSPSDKPEPTPVPTPSVEPTAEPPAPEPSDQPEPSEEPSEQPSKPATPPAVHGNTFFVSNNWTATVASVVFSYGRAGDEDYVGDFDGDGKDTFAVRRGNTFYVQNSLVGGNAEQVFSYGRAGDEVLVGDFDGDGKDTFAVRRGNTFYVQNSLVGGNAEQVFSYGRADDQVLAGDFDGDGKDTFAVRRGNTFHISNQLTGGDAEATLAYGRHADAVFLGDWDGNGTDTPAVRR